MPAVFLNPIPLWVNALDVASPAPKMYFALSNMAIMVGEESDDLVVMVSVYHLELGVPCEVMGEEALDDVECSCRRSVGRENVREERDRTRLGGCLYPRQRRAARERLPKTARTVECWY